MGKTNTKTRGIEVIHARLRSERGRLRTTSARVAMVYPSAYQVGMSSLGFQRILRSIDEDAELGCERAFVEEDVPFVTYESQRAVSSFDVLAFSVAYELELAGVIKGLQNAMIPPLRSERGEMHPLVIAGGPLTFSNPAPLGAFCDAVIMGEAEFAVNEVLKTAFDSPRASLFARLSSVEGVWLPALSDRVPAKLLQVDDSLLPATSLIVAEDTELTNMFLIEATRGCSRGCNYCVMRRSTNGGMRIVPREKMLELIPADAKRVGLVGASVSDHPKIVSIVSDLADRGVEVGLSSLRPDKLKIDFVKALKKAGYRTLTTAMDGISERLRTLMDRRAEEHYLLAAAQNAREVGMDRLKLYLMLGLPTETHADIDEGASFLTEVSKIVPVAVGIAPFCPKLRTPLSDAEFAGVALIDDHLDRLRAKLRGRVDLRATSAKWAWVEAKLAKGDVRTGHAVLEAEKAGGTFAAYKRALGHIAHERRLHVVE